jgi:2-methylisocitrate lyase-like PEP mutase family enzyme
MSRGSQLRKAFAGLRPAPIASVQDALTARIAEAAGFPVVVIGGSTVSNALLGMPDSGVITLTEMEFVASRVTAATEIPVIVDTDAGYGNAINVIRTIKRLESAGAAGVFIEDQENPPRCGGVAGRLLVQPSEMVGKVHAAADARSDENFVVIARTDAYDIEGLDALIERGQRYVEAGAEGFFAAGVSSLDELGRIVEEVPAPFHIAYLPGSRNGFVVADLDGIGVSGFVSGMTPLRLGALETLRSFEILLRTGSLPYAEFLSAATGSPLQDWDKFAGFDLARRQEERYLPADLLARRYGATLDQP